MDMNAKIRLMPIKHLPNIISLLRLFLVAPFIYFFLNNQLSTSFALFILAAFSDGIDGWIARFFNCQSRLGLILDPLADKVLIIVCFILLGYKHFLPISLVALVLLRDMAILFGAFISLFILKKKQPLYPTIMSKFNTVFQMFLIIFCLYDACFQGVPIIVIQIMSILVGATTSISFVQYLYKWHQEVRKNEKKCI